MSKLFTTLQAAKALNVSPQTLRRWEGEGRVAPAEWTSGGQRRYDLAKLAPNLFRPNIADHRRTIAYARVSSHDQKDVLDIITVFLSRLYGSRSRKNQKLLDGIQKAVDDVLL